MRRLLHEYNNLDYCLNEGGSGLPPSRLKTKIKSLQKKYEREKDFSIKNQLRLELVKYREELRQISNTKYIEKRNRRIENNIKPVI